MVTKNIEMAEELNQFFTSVFTRDTSTSIPQLTKKFKQSTDPIVMTEGMIRDKIADMRKDTAAVPDGITLKLLKMMRDSILKPLVRIFQKSLEESKVPKECKNPTEVPIPKKGSKREAGNYRPVSLISIPCKLLAAVVKDKMMDHLVTNNLIKSTQHGFMPGQSCATNLISFQDGVVKARENGKIYGCHLLGLQ